MLNYFLTKEKKLFNEGERIYSTNGTGPAEHLQAIKKKKKPLNLIPYPKLNQVDHGSQTEM